MGRCAGEPFAAFSGCAILSSYLVLFIMFYIATYKKNSRRANKKGGDKASMSSMKQSAVKVADSCSGVEHINSSIVSRK